MYKRSVPVRLLLIIFSGIIIEKKNVPSSLSPSSACINFLLMYNTLLSLSPNNKYLTSSFFLQHYFNNISDICIAQMFYFN